MRSDRSIVSMEDIVVLLRSAEVSNVEGRNEDQQKGC